ADHRRQRRQSALQGHLRVPREGVPGQAPELLQVTASQSVPASAGGAFGCTHSTSGWTGSLLPGRAWIAVNTMPKLIASHGRSGSTTPSARMSRFDVTNVDRSS